MYIQVTNYSKSKILQFSFSHFLLIQSAAAPSRLSLDNLSDSFDSTQAQLACDDVTH